MQQKQQFAKKERLQQFNQHVEELRANLKQDLAKKVPATYSGGGGRKGEPLNPACCCTACLCNTQALQLQLAPALHRSWLMQVAMLCTSILTINSNHLPLMSVWYS